MKMKSIKTIIEELIVENDIEDEFFFIKINDVWEKKFHPTLQKNIKLNKYKNKILYLKTDSPAWKQEISLRSNILCQQFNQYLGEILINKIII